MLVEQTPSVRYFSPIYYHIVFNFFMARLTILLVLVNENLSSMVRSSMAFGISSRIKSNISDINF